MHLRIVVERMTRRSLLQVATDTSIGEHERRRDCNPALRLSLSNWNEAGSTFQGPQGPLGQSPGEGWLQYSNKPFWNECNKPWFDHLWSKVELSLHGEVLNLDEVSVAVNTLQYNSIFKPVYGPLMFLIHWQRLSCTLSGPPKRYCRPKEFGHTS